MEKQREFRYVGEPCLTRGEFGVRVDGGHTLPEDPGGIYVFDPDVGDVYFGAVGSPDFEEIVMDDGNR